MDDDDDGDVITDFQDGIDRMRVRGDVQFDDLTILQVGSDTVVRIDDDDDVLVIIQGVNSNLITAADFA